MRECVVEEKTVELFESTGWLARKCVYAGRRGSPDRWFLKRGKWVLVEFKKPGLMATPQQKREHDRLRAHGQPVYTIESVEGGRWLHAQIEFKMQHDG
jgi:hypothetical protein